MKRSLFTGVAGILLASSQLSPAVPITGSIGIVGNMAFNTGTAATATAGVSWVTPLVASDSGVFAAPSLFQIPVDTPVAMSLETWFFNTATPIPDFWMVGGFTFELLSSYIAAQGGTPGLDGYVDVDGIGIVSGNGYDPTMMSFDLTSQDPISGYAPDGGPLWTFSASGLSSSSVADGGSTAVMLGAALMGLWLMSRNRLRLPRWTS